MMSILMDGISSVNALTSQIKSLSESGTISSYDPKAVEYILEKNFNQMLEDLVAAADSDDDDDDQFDPFSFLNTNSSALSIESATDENAELYSLAQFQDNPLALQSFLNLNI